MKVFDLDRKFAHTNACCVVDRVRDGGGYASHCPDNAVIKLGPAIASGSTMITTRVAAAALPNVPAEQSGWSRANSASHLHAPLSIHALSVTRPGRGKPGGRKDKKPRVQPAQMRGCAAQVRR